MRAAGPTPLSDPRAARAPPAGLLLLLLLAAAVFLAALLIGSSDIGLRAALAALGGSGDAATRSVLIGVRLPRVLAAFGVGRIKQFVHAGPGKVGPADAPGKQRVSDEREAVADEAHAARAVPRRMAHDQVQTADLQSVAVDEPAGRYGRGEHIDPEELARAGGSLFEHLALALVNPERCARRLAHRIDRLHVVEVPVRVHDRHHAAAMPPDGREDALRLVARVDDEQLAGGIVTEQVAVGLNGPDRKPFEDHTNGGPDPSHSRRGRDIAERRASF